MSQKTFESADGEPLRADITHGAFANPMLKAVLHKFGKRAFARSSACMEFEALLRRIAQRPRFAQGGAEIEQKSFGLPRIGGTCLEIGTYNGITAVVLSQFFDKVICVSVDAEDLKRNIIKRDIVQFLGITNIEFHDVLDNQEKAHVIEHLQFDFAFSDGDHTHDTYSDFDLIKHCGRVLFHEAWPIQAPVWNLVHSLPESEVTWAEADCFAFWERRGG